ncbi:MAG: ATP-binding protein [Trichococcus flocculiformis]|jgi:AAA15 family ATPase/GTPase
MIHILRSEIDGLTLFKDKKVMFDLVAEKNVTEDDVLNGNVMRIDDLIDKLNTIALVGSNATGKTTQLRLIKMVISVFLALDSLNEFENLADQFEDTFRFTNYFYNAKTLYKVESAVKKTTDGDFAFIEETIYSKKVYPSHKKSELFNFDLTKRGQQELLRRSSLPDEITAFLRDDDTIFSTIVRKIMNNKVQDIVIDEIDMTNKNKLTTKDKIPVEYIKYFDPSIESIRILSKDVPSEKMNVEVTFKNDSIIQVPLIELSNYLSSGTIKGINLFIDIEKTLKNGGYLIIDEIENHLHKSIIMNIIQLFANSLNKNGATLIFSTHYSEIIDMVPRTDMIYVATKEENLIQFKKMSQGLGDQDRNDKKKSEVLLSGKLSNTPTYKDLKRVRAKLRSAVSETSSGSDGGAGE